MVVIVIIVIVIMRMRVPVMMIMADAQQPGADEIDGEAEAGHRNRLAIDDRDW